MVRSSRGRLYSPLAFAATDIILVERIKAWVEMAYHTSLNLKSDEAYRLARELADRTGENMTKAVIVALRDRLERVKRSDRQGLSERLLAIGRECAAHLSEEARSIDHDALLYDEKTGLPRDC